MAKLVPRNLRRGRTNIKLITTKKPDPSISWLKNVNLHPTQKVKRVALVLGSTTTSVR